MRCAEICREVGSSSLGIPETCLLGLAGLLSRDAGTIYNELLHPIRRAACQGILPHLKGVVDREIKSGRGISKKAKLPDSQRNPDSYGIDPFGSDYFCFTCKRELANSYFHCLGCESLLQKDLNICRMCLEEKKHGKNIYMGFKGKTRNSDIIHAGVLEKKRNTRGCMCRQGICRDCGYCKSCSCSCHHDFQLHYRFYMPDELKDIAKRVEEIAARPNDDQIETCAGELQENCSNLPDSTNSPMQKTRPVDQAENRDAGPIVNHDVLPACTSKLQENHSTFPGPVDPSTQKALTQPNDQAEDRDAGHSMNHNVLPAPSVAFTCKTTPQLNVKTNAFSNTPKDLPPITEDVPAFPKYYTDVKTDYA